MKKIIITESNDDAEQSELAKILSDEYECVAVCGAAQLFACLKEKASSISAIITEYRDDKILKKLHSNATYRQIPLIVIATAGEAHVQLRAAKLGANGYLEKPLNKSLLKYTLANVISLHEATALIVSTEFDALTGLLNRTAFFEKIEKLIYGEAPGYYILVCFDIDNFKVINDQYGSDTGDRILKHIAKQLAACAKTVNGVCCRFAADNFGLLYPAKFKGTPILNELYERASFSKEIGKAIRIRVGRYIIDDTTLAVSAMYDRATLAEESIRGRYDTFIAEYNDTMRSNLLNEQQIVDDMNEALANGEFEPWLQPQYNHSTGALIGAEALVRWKKNGKYIPPDRFVPVFERNGFIYEMDQYIWEAVCKLLRRWLDEGLTPLPVSVNISRKDIFHGNFVGVLDNLIKKYSLPYDMLRLEVTESAFAETSGKIIAKVGDLIKMGFTVEIDDFGSGYSSLNTLKDVPASILKLDMKFFENTANTQRGGNIVESVVRMAKWLGMAVIAEGVEEKEQADYLKSIGCNYIQGYFYSKPVPVDEYEKLLHLSSKEPRLTSLETLETLNNSEFWNPKSMETLIFNSFVGGACIFEYRNGKTELLRTNTQYTKELGGLIHNGASLKDSSIVRFLDENNKKKIGNIINEAIELRRETNCGVRLINENHKEYLRVTLRLIARAADRYLFYCVIVNVTEQHEAERKQLEVIMNNVNGGVSAVQIDKAGNSTFVFCNERYYELYGYTKAQIEEEKLDVMKTILPEDLPAVLEKVEKLKTDRLPVIIDYRIRKRDGKLANLRANASLMYMEGYGDVITSVITDITEVRSLSDKLSAVIENINGGMSAIHLEDDQPKFVVVNEQYYDIIGYTKEQLKNEVANIFDLVYPPDRAKVEGRFREAIKHTGRYTLEYRIIRRDGAVRNILCNANVIHLFGIEGTVQLSVSSDITNLREAQQKENIAFEKLEAVLSHAGSGITAITLNEEKAEFLFANDKYFEITGYTRDEYMEKTKSDMLALIHPLDREDLRRRVTEINKNGGSLTSEYRVVQNNGAIIWVKSAITITNIAGIASPVQIAVFSDITEEKSFRDQMSFLNEAAHDILAQPDSNIAVDRMLERLLGYFDGDRSYVIEMDYENKVSNNTYEKCAANVSSELNNLQNIPFEVSEYWFSELRENGFVVIEDVKALNDDKAELRELLLAQNIFSIIIAPLFRDGSLVGFVGIYNPKKATNQLGRLKALGDYIAITLTRRDLSAKIDSDRKMMAALMDDTPGGFVRMKLTANGRFLPVYSNDGLAEMLKMSREALHGIYANDALAGVHPEDRGIVESAAKKMLSDGSAQSARFRVINGDNEYIWLTLYGRTTKDPFGVTYLNIYYSDANTQIKEEEKQKNLLDNLPCGAALYEFDGKNISAVHINKSYWLLVKRSAVDNAKISVFDSIHPDDRDIVLQEVEAAIRQNRNASVSFRIRYGDNGYKPFHVEAKVTMEKSGNYLFFAAYTPIEDETMSVQEMLPIALSTMMSVSEDLSYVKDKDLNYICCSASVAKVLGLASARDIIGKNDTALFAGNISEDFIEHDRKIIASGESLIGYRESINDYEGRTRLVRTSKYPITDAVGNVIGIYGISRDITAQHEKESQLELLTSSIPGGLAAYSISEKGIKMLYFNDGFYKFSGYSREDYAKMVDIDPLTFVFEEDRPAIQKMIRNFSDNKEDGHVNGCVYRCHKKDGGHVWMSMKTVLSQIGEQDFIVNAVQLDITEQQEEKERLRISEELNRLAIEQSGNIITRFDVANRTLTLPESLNPIFKLPHVLNGMPEEQIALGRVSPDTADIYRTLFESIVNGEPSGSATFKQNSVKGFRWLEAHFTTVFSANKKPVSAVISFSDITEKLEKEVVYNKWQQSFSERAEDSYTLFRCNLSRQSSFDSREGELIDFRFSNDHLTFDELTKEYASQCVYEEDTEKYLEFLNSDTLLAHYYRGRRSFQMEYREKTKNEMIRWIKLSVDLVEYPSSRDVEIYLMYKNIDEQKKAALLTLERSERDPLTKAYNRATFIRYVEEALQKSQIGTQHAILMMDIDNFKSINDTYGHQTGDGVLINLATKIRAILRRDDIIGRLGGDEFFVFLINVKDRASAEAKARQILATDMSTSDMDKPVGVSIGVAMVPKDGNTFDELYKNADTALYTQKANGKNGFRFASE